MRNEKGQFVKGYNPSPETQFKRGKPSPRKGVPKPGWTNKTSFQPARSLWATNVRKYQSIHLWMKTHYGQPQICEFCKRVDLVSTQYHWSNKSGKYLKDLSDWQRLCFKCHREYDGKTVSINRAAKIIAQTHYNKGLIITAGNGGSLSMASHMVGELIGSFEDKNREPIAAIALNDPGVISAIANDFGFDNIFSRQIEALGNNKNTLIGFTTSDINEQHSLNLLKAVNRARAKKMKIILIGSKKTIKLRINVNCFVQSTALETAEIQNEQYEFMHKICRELENILARRKYMQTFKNKI